jgi:hypothetical protein
MTPKIRPLHNKRLCGLFLAVLLLFAACNNQPQIQQQADSATPTSHPTLSPTFLTEEAKYNATLKAGNVPPPPSPLPTPTPTYFVITSTQAVDIHIFEGQSAYQERPRFQVTFSTQEWRLEDDYLHHEALADCMLALGTGGGGMPGPMIKSQIELAGYTWEVRAFPSERTISYYAVTEELASYYFILTYDKTIDENSDNPCQAAGETVINTFTTVPMPLRYEATHYTITYPVDWQVEESQESNYVVIFPPSGQTVESKIEFAYLGYEISEEDDLLEWYNQYTKLGTGEVPERTIISNGTVQLSDGSISRQLHEQHASGDGAIQAVLIQYGKLVLSINAYTTSAEMTELLKTIAAALEFHPDAPKTLAELTQATPESTK